MTMPTLEKGCCCCKLKTCVCIQAYVNLIACVIIVLFNTYILLGADRKKTEETEEVIQNIKYISIGLLVYGLIGGVLAGLMIFGIRKSNRKLLLPFMIVSALLIVANIAILCKFSNTATTLAFSCQVVSIFLASYIWLHVFSYYEQLGEQSAPESEHSALPMSDLAAPSIESPPSTST